MQYKTCKHNYDSGGTCGSAAAADRDYCTYHLRCRARALRMAQYRARQQRWYLQFPPLENMHSVQSALTQLGEALAADMIDLKSADRLLAVLRLASRNLLKSDKWPATSIHSDQPGPALDLAAEYGLPNDPDLDLPPEAVFPAPAAPETGNWQPATDNCDSPMPTVDYCSHGPGCPEHTIRADYPETPELAELHEIQATQGIEAAVERYKQQQRNRQRRQFSFDRKRYGAIAMEKNMRLAAEKMAERKLAEKAAATPTFGSATLPASGWPIPPVGGGVGTFPDTDKKPVASVSGTGEGLQKEAQSIA
jgi:hypothetical protein